jgi:hypothetical protein
MSHILLYIIKEVHPRNIRFRAERKYISEISIYKNLVILSIIHLSARFLAASRYWWKPILRPANERLAAEQQLI